MIPDFDTAAIKAMETIIKFGISSAPVDPLPILKKMQGVVVLPFAEVAHEIGEERETVLEMFGDESRAAVTTYSDGNYFVVYNQQMPFILLQRALARELGHIVLKHDGSRPVDSRMGEAYCFAHHLLCPRPLIKLLQESPFRVTVEMLGNVTGCYEECLDRMNRLPGTNVPAELNRKVKEQFEDYVRNFMRYQAIIAGRDNSRTADFGTFMEGYAE